MKTKLLKKIRKRYLILHYPDGIYWRREFIEGPYTVLWDNENDYRYTISKKPKKEAYEDLHAYLVRWIELDYGPYKNQRNRKVDLLWYKSGQKRNSNYLITKFLEIKEKIVKFVKKKT